MQNKSIDQNNTNENNSKKRVNHFKTQEGKATFRTRLISSVVLLLILALYITSGALYTYLNEVSNFIIWSYLSIIFTMIICAFGSYEINKATGFKKWYYQVILISLALVLYIFPITTKLYNFSFYLEMNLYSWLQPWHFALFLSLSTLIYVILGAIEYKNIAIKNTLINLLFNFIIIIAMKTYSIVSLDLLDSKTPMFSFNTILWIWVMIILGDSFAYIGGMSWGKTKLAPKISPKKSWEGAGFGLTIAFLFGIGYVAIFYFIPSLNSFKPLNVGIESLNKPIIEFLIYVLLAAIFPIIGLFGDLAFSWVKRVVNIKDYSNLIPGHGGVLDRLDSIIISLFVLFFIVISIG
ncbi:phosphatidate cytidylyltransferase [Spiroplasma gladiatoris]|uniref:Phosphatidate cytidylyltransferase n=1 Tax=Spiroplasma gladiatoris TaxID=2143 RepID=A0A4P7AK24_9MOLU|nr:phosphatidate cytidylyltransferase [Spiroplasma gladiatoris]QBQ07910.1 phosphatidate cytidylyltransferase [Spiroplasma gladiatoris]